MSHTRNFRKVLKAVITITGAFLVLSCAIPQTGLAIEPGNPPQPTTGEVMPGIPGREERPIASSQPESRALVQQPRQTQRRFADSYLPQSIQRVTDPQDGLRQDGRVAVLEGLHSQVVYQFYQENKVVNEPGQPDLTIYTHDKGGFDGPYNVFVSNFGESSWTQLGSNVMGTTSFDLPPHMEAAELVLLINLHNGATYIEAVEGVTLSSGATEGSFSYFPENLIGLRVTRLDCAEVERAKMILTAGGAGYQLVPMGEIEIQWNSPISNEWKKEEFHIEAEGEYEIYASDSRGMENFIGRRAGAQSIDLPQNMTDAAKVRIRNHNNNRPVIIYAIVGRR